MTPKVVFLDHALNGGGAERVMCTIMRSVPATQASVHLVIIDRLGALAGLVPAHVSVHELGVRHTRNAIGPLVRKLRELRPTVVFSTTEHVSLLTIVARALTPRHRVVTRFPIMPSLATRERASGFIGWRGALLRWMYRQSDIVVAQSDEMAGELRSILGVPLEKIRTIPNPVDSAHILASLEGAGDPYAGLGAGERIVASGTLTPRKGFDVLLRAFAALRVRRPEAKLFVLGRDADGHRSQLERLAAKLGVQANVTFTGYCPNPYPYVRFADLFVLSSRAEGLPNALLEARVLGRRAVAVECVPVVSRIMDGKYLVPVGDHERLAVEMERALAGPPLAPLVATGTDGFLKLLLEG